MTTVALFPVVPQVQLRKWLGMVRNAARHLRGSRCAGLVGSIALLRRSMGFA